LTLRPIHGAIAAALALSLGLGGVIGYLLGQAGQPIAYSFVDAPSSAPGATARLVYFKDRKQAVLTVNGLPRLAAGHVYEIWLIKGGVPVDEGIGTGPDGTVGLQLLADLSQFDDLAITIEPGEQQLPTTTPILIGHLGAAGRRRWRRSGRRGPRPAKPLPFLQISFGLSAVRESRPRATPSYAR
jgi:hypothetical protein